MTGRVCGVRNSEECVRVVVGEGCGGKDEDEAPEGDF